MIYLFCSVDVINMQDSFVIIFHYVGNCEICLHYWVQMSILEHFAFRGEKWSWYSDHLVTFCHRQTKYNAHIFHTCHIKSPLLTLHSILTISIISTVQNSWPTALYRGRASQQTGPGPMNKWRILLKLYNLVLMIGSSGS